MEQEIANNLVSTFYIGDTRWGINIINTQEVIKIPDITKVHNAPDYVEGIINLRGRIVTIISLCKKLKIPTNGIDSESRIIIVSDGDEYIGLLVDRISDVVEVEYGELTPAPETIHGANGSNFEGIYHQNDITISVLNLPKVLSLEDDDI